MSTITLDKPTNKRGRPLAGQEKVDIGKAFKLRYKNHLSMQEVADHFGVHKSTIEKHLHAFESMMPNSVDLEAYNQNKSHILAAAEYKLLGKITDEDTIKSASLNNAAYAFLQINNANRLEKGLATDIYDSFSVTANLEDLQKREQELLKKIEVKIIQSGEDPPVKEGKVGKG